MITFDQIHKYFTQGWSYKDIGKQLGVSRQRIQQVLKSRGYSRGHMRIPAGPIDEQALKKTPFYRYIRSQGYRTVQEYLNRLPLRQKVRMEVMRRDNFTCQYCGRKSGEAKLSVTHKTPLGRFGPGNFHVMENLITACRNCSSKKGYRTHEEFLANKRVTMYEALGEKYAPL